MKEKYNNIPDLDDLLFESRNKEYGAYQLRKKYNSVLFTGIIIASFFGCSAVVIPFIARTHSERNINGGGKFVQVTMENFEPPMDQIIVPPAPPPPESSIPQEIVKYVPPVVVDSVIPFDKTQATTDEILANSGDNQLLVEGTGTGEDLTMGGEGSGNDEPFFLVEVMPSFKGGGLNKFREWVQKRTNYPQEALDRKIHGKVFLTFIIEPDGSLTNVTIIKGVDPLIDTEAVKAIEGSPKWSPGLQRGQPVRVRYSMALNFEI